MERTPEGPTYRRAARVLIVDEADRVLLFFGAGLVRQDADYYFTVGGGVEEGETLAEAAAREVREETGLRVSPADLGPLVAHTEGEWTTHDGVRFYSDDNFFFLRVAHFEVSLDGLEEGEEKEISRHEWLTLDDLDATDAIVFPVGLNGVLKRLLSGESPETPIELPWHGGEREQAMPADTDRVRRCARVIVADHDDRLLLLHSSGWVTPETEFFVSIGGLIDPGESAAEAAARELLEETGLAIDPSELGPVVGRTAGHWMLGYQEDLFFFLRTPRFEVRFDRLEAGEVDQLNGSAWLDTDQLASVDHAVFPVPIAALAKRMLDGETPAEPVELPWANWTGTEKRCPIPIEEP